MTEHATSHAGEYAIEGLLLGAFLVAASAVTIALEHPASPLGDAIGSGTVRRGLTGLAMGLTAVALIYSRPGRRSGAHMNPVVTLVYWRLGKVAGRDALGYAGGQFAGATAAMLILGALAGPWLAHPAVDYVRTRPGPSGPGVAWLAEAAISLGMMLVVLAVSNSRWRAFTGLCAGALVAVYITAEAPLSGMSMNPARSLGPSVAAGMPDGLWIYFTAPVAGMLAGAELYVRRRGLEAIACAKLHHDASSPCPFRCRFHAAAAADAAAPERPAESPTPLLTSNPVPGGGVRS